MHPVADRGGPLQRDALASLTDVQRVTALEARGAGELRVSPPVVVWLPVTHKVITRPNTGTEEPPFVAGEDEMAIGDLAHLRGGASVTRVGGDGERLRGEDRAVTALRGPSFVVVQWVGVVHRLHPPANVADVHRVLQLTGLDRHAHVLVQVGLAQ